MTTLNDVYNLDSKADTGGIEKAESALKSLDKAQAELGSHTKTAAVSVAGFNADLKTNVGDLGKGETATKGLSKAQSDLGTNTKKSALSLADLNADLKTNAANVEKDETAVKGLGKAQDEMGTNTKKSALSLTDLKSGLDMVGNVGGKVVDFMKESIGKATEYANTSQTLSRSLGVTTEESSKLMYATNLVGMSQEDLEKAMKSAEQHGINPNMAGLEKLADQYNAIQAPVQKAQFITKTFGKEGLNMGELLAKGSEGIRKAGEEAEQFGLIVDQKAVEAAKKMEEETNQLNARLDGLKVKVGNTAIALADKLADAADQASNSVHMLNEEGNHYNDTMIAHEAEVAKTDNLYKDYAVEMERSGKITGALSEITDESTRAEAEAALAAGTANGKYILLNDTLYQVTNDLKIKSEAEFQSTKRSQEDAVAQDKLKISMDAMVGASAARSAWTIRNAAEINAQRQALQDLANQGYGDLKVAMSGALQGEMESFSQKQDDLKTKAAELQSTISTSYGKAKDDAVASLKDVNASLATDAAAHEEATHKILFGYAEQAIAAENSKKGIIGVTTDEEKALDDLAIKWNLKSVDDITAIHSIQDAASDLAAGGSVDQFEQQVEDSMPGAKKAIAPTTQAINDLHVATGTLAAQANTSTFATGAVLDMKTVDQAMLDAQNRMIEFTNPTVNNMRGMALDMHAAQQQALDLQGSINGLTGRDLAVTLDITTAMTNSAHNGPAPASPAGGASPTPPSGSPPAGYIPHYATGGIISRPTLAMVGDNRQSPEAVAPLSDLINIIKQALAGSAINVNVHGPYGPAYTPEQAGRLAGQGVTQAAAARGLVLGR